MKDFLKFTLASLIGVILAGIVLTILGLITVVGMVASYTYGFAVAEEAFAQAGVKLVTLTDYEHVVERALETGYIQDSDVELLHRWRKDPAHYQV